jgi:hypothetical protein
VGSEGGKRMGVDTLSQARKRGGRNVFVFVLIEEREYGKCGGQQKGVGTGQRTLLIVHKRHWAVR